MFQTMTQIGKTYGIDAKTVGKILYEMNLRDAKHPEQKGFPFEQTVTHGIAKAFTGRSGERYYKYDIERIKEEFEAKATTALHQTSGQTPVLKPDSTLNIESNLKSMLSLLNEVLQTGEIGLLHRMKAEIADIYTMLPRQEVQKG